MKTSRTFDPVPLFSALPLCINQEQRLAREELAAKRAERLPPSNLVSAVQLSGPLNVHVLSQAVEDLVARHSALRSTVRACRNMPPTIRFLRLQTFARSGVYDPGLFEQTVQPASEVGITAIPVENVGREEYDDVIATLFDEETSTPFDYTRPPLLRARLVRTAASAHTLVVAGPHLVLDAWSLPVLWRDPPCANNL